MFTLTITIHIILEILAMTIKEKKKKGIQIRKEVKLSLFSGDMKAYIQNPKDYNRKLLQLINEFANSQIQINAQKFLAFLYTTMKF